MLTKEQKEIEEHILGSVEDAVSNLLYYDRKEDEELPRGAIEAAIINRPELLNEIVKRFRENLIKYLTVN